ncbi:MBL fold metallo-hydrolase [Mycolicibacterium sp. P9-22]|uniref:MBL fold metallo-hydrolase n=1 Tax=Mycolicibacterium sp. P9-22 TaxID=2024613 RepID=UPI0011F02EDD|nr:MBL fold metallo-hydrolase [Mycolicibacterium sp. P9-22]KAA0118216.1 MBL fold metallo-hydrolase [Mycolicibacterium sp. P9-22]
MKIRSLGWAGIELSAQGVSLVIDHVVHTPIRQAALPDGTLCLPGRPAAAALVTHLHSDHTDVAAIEAAVGATGLVFRPAPFHGTEEEGVWTAGCEHDLKASALQVRVVQDWARIDLAPFTITAVPAVDGLGDPQVNWVVEADGQRVFHGGDTTFHGYWWLIARRAGPIDVAVLPINGAAVQLPHMQPASPLPAVLTPEQAAHAAAILQAKTVLPMHFGIDEPPLYVEQADALSRLHAAAAPLALRVVTLASGQVSEIAA